MTVHSATKSEQVRTHVLKLIADELKPHDKLPTERNLASDFGVTRLIVRQVLSRLETEGRIYRKQGAGTFVSEPRIAKTLALTSFTEDMQARGLHPSSRILSWDTAQAGSAVAAALLISPKDHVIRIERLRYADAEPMCYELVYLPTALVPEFTEDDLNISLYETLESRYRIKIDKATQEIHATITDEHTAEQLGVGIFFPVLKVSRTSLDITGRRIEYAESIYRGDRYNYELTIYRVPAASNDQSHVPSKLNVAE